VISSFFLLLGFMRSAACKDCVVTTGYKMGLVAYACTLTMYVLSSLLSGLLAFTVHPPNTYRATAILGFPLRRAMRV
jgi:hypothetical protein